MSVREIMMAAAGADGGAPPSVSYWLSRLSSASSDIANAVVVDSSDNVFVAGQTGNSAYVCKYNSSGSLVWQKNLASQTAAAIAFASIQLDSSGNIYVCGTGGYSTYTVPVVIKYDSSGTIIWNRRLRTTSGGGFAGITIDSSENIYAVGGSYIVKYNSSGTIQWQKILSPSANLAKVVADSSGNIYATGNYSPSGNADIIVLKFDSSGNISWQRTLTSSGNYPEDARGIAIDSSNNIYISGFGRTSTTTATIDFLLAKYDSSGVLQWQRALASANVDQGTNCAVDPSGNVYLCGFPGTTPQAFAKYNSSGTLQWQRALSISTTTRPNGIYVSSSGSLYIVGYTNLNANDMTVSKLPDDGSKTGTYGSYTYSATSYTSPTSVLVDSAGSFTISNSTLTEEASGGTQSNGTLTNTLTTVP